MSQLCAIAAISNPAGYKSRFRLYQEFRSRIAASGVALYTVELATGDQPFAVTDPQDPYGIQVRSDDVIWYKENLMNVALRRIPDRFDHVAFLDADIMFVRPDWPEQTQDLLDRHAFVQMFSHAMDLGPHYEPLKIYEGFAHGRRARGSENAAIGQTGYAWAVRREALENLGGLLDWCILGSNDYFMALALAGTITPELTRAPGTNYAKSLLDWQSRCEPYRGIGCLGGMILHFWHGRRTERGYDTRWRILIDNRFDPEVDLKRELDGLLRLAGNKPALQMAITSYFASRNEDGMDL